MKKLLSLFLCAVLSSSVFASDKNETSAGPSCGYWDYIDVEVCDVRQVPVIKDITECEYLGPWRNGEPMEAFRRYDGHISCPSINNFRLLYQTHTTKTTYETERFNCRMEQRRIWVRTGGPRCGAEP